MELFLSSKKTYSTCSICRAQKKKIRDNQKRKRQEIENQNLDMDLIEYDDLMDEYLSTFEEFKDGENKENGFNFVKVLNIISLISSTPKDIAKGIIDQINDADNFNWRYV
jgi:hypothetical protein